jgi:hypothetical protein
VRDSAWSPLGRLDLHQAPDQVGQRMGLFTDGMSPTYLLQEAYARSGAFEDTWGRLMALPYRAFRPTRVLYPRLRRRGQRVAGQAVRGGVGRRRRGQPGAARAAGALAVVRRRRLRRTRRAPDR